MIAAAQIPVASPDHADVHAGQLERRGLLGEPAKLPGKPVVLTAHGLHERDLGGSHVRGDSLQEEPQRVRIRLGAIEGLARPDDVVAEHALHVVAGRGHLLGHVGRAIKAFLFPIDSSEYESARELASGEDPGELQHDGDAGRVVIGARRITGEVKNVGAPGVQVPGYDIETLGRCGPLQRCDHVRDRRWHRDIGRYRLRERLLQHCHPAPGRSSDVLHQPGHIGDRHADATIRVGLARRGVPGAEAGQLRDDGLNAGRINLVEQFPQVGV
jgi:hypothetical protein